MLSGFAAGRNIDFQVELVRSAGVSDTGVDGAKAIVRKPMRQSCEVALDRVRKGLSTQNNKTAV